MAGLREQKKKATRAAIMDAAMTLFGERGYENTSISALAKAAGVGKGTIYSYFKSKNEILLAFCEEELAFIHEEVGRKLAPDAPFLERMVFLFMSEFRYVTKNKNFGRTLMREMIFPREITVKKSKELENRFINLFVGVVMEAQKNGQLRNDTDPVLTFAHFYSLYLLTVSIWYSERLQNKQDVQSMLEVMFEQAVNGLYSAGPESSRKKQAAELVQKVVHKYTPDPERQTVSNKKQKR